MISAYPTGASLPPLGSHTSIAGGLYRAVERAHDVGCDCVQLFTGNPRSFPTTQKGTASAAPLNEEEVTRFREALRERSICHPIAHNSYLINLANPAAAPWRRSIESFVVELQRAEQLGLAYVVTHPGASLSSSEQQGLARVAAALDEIHAATRRIRARILLETTAGQGSCLGSRFEHLAEIIGRVRHPERLGVCVDTCHIFAAGYPLATKRQYRATMRKLATIVGLEKVKAFHLNDSKRELGSHVDRHEHIGQGHLGLEPFRHLLNDARFERVPMYLETAKGTSAGEDLDVINLRTLRGLIE